jgi:D-glycero-D-manno-heptose 1,7-bisphosphate phosphatase
MQAVILAGGKGTRLGALAAGRPKPLIEVGGKPFICYLIASLRRHGITDIVLLVGGFVEAFRYYLSDGAALGVKLTLVSEDPPADTAGALIDAAPHLHPHFLLLNGDSFFDFNLLDIFARPTKDNCLVRLALREVEDVGRYGAVVLDGDRVMQFGEKSTSGRGLINAGVYWMKREILDEIGDPPVSLERKLLPNLAMRGLLSGSIYDARFIDIGIPEDLERAATLLPDWERRPAAFLDRDGVLNRDTGYVHREEDFIWIDGAKEAIKHLNDCGWLVIVVTNQAGVARGFYEPADVEQLHRWINAQLQDFGAHVDAFYYCPHHPAEGRAPYRQICDCRKPAPGLLLRAMSEWSIDIKKSFMVGDKESDMAAARDAGVKGILYDGQNLGELVRRITQAC